MAAPRPGALLAARATPVDAVYIFAGLALQQAFDARAPRLKFAGREPTASVGHEPTKICPTCGAEIRKATQLCYYYRSFDPQPQRTPTTSAPAARPSHSTDHLGRIVLYGILLVIATITLVLLRNEVTCGRRACVPTQSAVPRIAAPLLRH